MKLNPDKIDRLLAGIFLSPGYRICRHALLIFVMTVISVYIVINHPHAAANSQNIIYGIISYTVSVLSAAYINIYVLIPRFLLTGKPFYYFFWMTVFVIVFLLVLLVMQIALFDLQKAFSEVNPLLILVNFFSSIITLGLMIAGVTTFVLLKYWNLSAQRIDQLQEASLQSELATLKNQINPHFLFNVINNANVLLKEKRGGASSILFKLEDLLRYQINESARERISLVSDIDFLTDYLNLEKVRRDRFDFKITTCGIPDSLMLPPLLFIPFVENAVKYSQDSENASYVYLVFTVNKEGFFFHCENSTPAEGIGHHKPGGLGLKNIRRRLELLFPGCHTLDMEQQTDKYVVNLYLKPETQP